MEEIKQCPELESFQSTLLLRVGHLYSAYIIVSIISSLFILADNNLTMFQGNPHFFVEL